MSQTLLYNLMAMCTPITKLLPFFIGFVLIQLLTSCKFNQELNLLTVLPYDPSYLDSNLAPDEAKLADILIIGGKEAKALEHQFIKVLSQNRESPSFYALTAEEYNILRLHYILTLQKFTPKWIIYLPSLNDELEEVFKIEEAANVHFNLKRMNTWWWRWTYKIWNGVALSLLKKTTKIILNNEKKVSLTPQTDAQKIQISLTHQALFQSLLNNLLEHYPKTQFILLSTPFDPNETPSNCKTHVSWPTGGVLNDIMKLIEEKKWDEALLKSEQLISLAPYYATTYYHRAKILANLGETEESIKMLNLAWMLNCRSPNISLKNKIIQTTALNYREQTYFYDFAKYISQSCFEKNNICYEDYELDSQYYNDVAKALHLLITER